MDIFNSALSFKFGLFFTVFASILIIVIIERLFGSLVLWLCSVIVPFIIANIIYLIPILILKNTSFDYSAWWLFFIISWGFSGMTGSVCVIFFCPNMRQII